MNEDHPVDPDDGDTTAEGSRPPEGDDEGLRHLLSALPEVAPPDGFFDDLIRTRRRRARLVAVVGLVAAGVAGAIVVAQATGITGDADPPMDDLADRHAEVTAVDVSTGAPMPDDDVPAPYQAPERLGAMERNGAVRHDDDIVQIIYTGDGHHVSVFEHPGDLDDAMAGDLTPAEVAGVDAWWTEDGALVVRRADVVYVLVGDVDPDEVTDLVDDLPDARPLGLARRIGDAMDDLVDAFGLS